MAVRDHGAFNVAHSINTLNLPSLGTIDENDIHKIYMIVTETHRVSWNRHDLIMESARFVWNHYAFY